jgi:hypothetical protein
MLDKAHLKILRNSAIYAAAGAIGCNIGSGAPIIIGFFLFFTMFVVLHLLGFPWKKRSATMEEANRHAKFYDEVALEMKQKPLNAGLWTKAFSEMSGDEAKARALYIKYRLAQLMEANLTQLKEERLAKLKRLEEERLAKQQQAKSLSFEVFEREYRGEIPLKNYSWYEQHRILFQKWRELRAEELGLNLHDLEKLGLIDSWW